MISRETKEKGEQDGMSDFENKILDGWNNSAKFKVEINMYDILEMLRDYLVVNLFKNKRSCKEEDVGLLKGEIVAFNFGEPEPKEHIFDEFQLSINIPFSEIQMLIENHIAPYVEKITDKKVIDIEINWGKRDDGFYHIDDTKIEITVEGEK